MTPIGPIAREDRMSCLDTLRGFALLGILPANVLIFGMYFAAAHDLTVTGGAAGANVVTWALVLILVDGKMRCLFSMVFGASTILLTSRAEERHGAAAADIYYRRTLWLSLFGLAHAFLLFWGDILYPYALCALILFPFRKLSAKRLLAIGAMFMVLNAASSVADGFRQTERRRLAAAADAARKAGKTPSDEQNQAKKAVEAQRKQRKPSQEDLEKEAKRWRGNPLEAIAARARELQEWHALPYYDPVNCDMWSMMFIGMGLFKLGVFSGGRSYRDYACIAVAGYLVGIPLNAFTAWLEFTTGFDRVSHAWIHSIYDIERLAVALAHMAALMILCKAGLLRRLTNRLAAIGQTALSNYILHSVVCTFVFTGLGLGLYGRLQRYQLYYVVAACWVVSLAASPVWLRHYRYGPLEWCWRSLTYWRRLPMRVRRPSLPARGAEAVA